MYNTIYDRHLLLTDNFPHTMIKIIDDAIKINPNLTAKEISVNLLIPFRSVQRYLSTLKEKGFIVREGSNKKGYWKIIN